MIWKAEHWLEIRLWDKAGRYHWVKRVHIWGSSGPYFPTIAVNKSLLIQAECEKIRTRKTPNADTFTQGMYLFDIFQKNLNFSREHAFWCYSYNLLDPNITYHPGLLRKMIFSKISNKSWNWDTSTSNQVSNCDCVVLEIFYESQIPVNNSHSLEMFPFSQWEHF